jgi:ABC-2 type transport system permease protein
MSDISSSQPSPAQVFWRGLWAIIIGEFRHTQHDSRQLMVLLLLPLIFSGVLAMMQTGEEGKLNIVFRGPDSGLLRDLREELQQAGVFTQDAQPDTERLIARDLLDLLVVVPANADADWQAGKPQHWSLLAAAGGLRGREASEALRTALLRLEARAVARRVVQPGRQDEAERRTEALLQHPSFEFSLEFAKTERSSATITPTGATQTTPGMTLMFALLFGGQAGLALQRERSAGVMARLYGAAVPGLAIIVGKMLGTTLLLLAQMVVMVGFSSVVLGLKWGNLLALGINWAAFALMASAFGLACASLTRNAAQLNALSVLFVCLSSALGGMWWPIDVVPSWMQALARGLPTFWGMQGVQGVMLRGHGVLDILPIVAVLLGFAMLFLWFGSKAFRYE